MINRAILLTFIAIAALIAVVAAPLVAESMFATAKNDNQGQCIKQFKHNDAAKTDCKDRFHPDNDNDNDNHHPPPPGNDVVPAIQLRL